MRRLLGSLLFGALAIACGSSSAASASDGGGSSSSRSDGGDASKTPDALALDAGTPKDGSVAHDAGASAAPTSDANTGTDAEALDAGARDASTDGSFEGHDGAVSEGGAGDGEAHDASTAAEGGGEGGVAIVTCGGATCYAGQSCVGGVCETTNCVGVHVPGDYPTVQAATLALGSLPAGGTICLGAQTYQEYVEARSTGGPVTIEGMGPAATIVEFFGTSSGSWALKGITFETISVAAITSLSITNVVVAPPPDGDYAILLTGSATGTVTLSGVDIQGNGATEAIAFSTGTTTSLYVESSYIHDTQSGLASLVPGSIMTVHVTNSTFANNTSGLDFEMAQGSTGSPVAAVYNSLFLSNGAGINLSNAGLAGRNGFYQNEDNYSGLAVPPTSGDVTANPMVNTASPPALNAGSPCRGAGDPAHAAATDFYGRPLGATPDIGAVQSSL